MKILSVKGDQRSGSKKNDGGGWMGGVDMGYRPFSTDSYRPSSNSIRREAVIGMSLEQPYWGHWRKEARGGRRRQGGRGVQVLDGGTRMIYIHTCRWEGGREGKMGKEILGF